MRTDIGEFLLAISGLSATLIGSFIVGVFFYLDLARYRSATTRATPVDRYMRAAVRWVFVAYSIPLLVPLVLVSAEPFWAAIAFAVLSATLLACTAGTIRRIVERGGSGSSIPLILNEWATTVAVLVAFVLPWALGGWTPSPSAYIPSLAITLAAGFASTAALIMAEFDSMIAIARPPGTPDPQSRRGARLGRS